MDQAEQLRNVIKLHNQNNQNNARVVTITSGKGGVGKSNLAVNLAVCLRKAGKRTKEKAESQTAKGEKRNGKENRKKRSVLVRKRKEI